VILAELQRSRLKLPAPLYRARLCPSAPTTNYYRSKENHMNTPTMPTTNLFEKLPNEILDELVKQLRVNDQICLALTAKRFASRIIDNKALACNSTNPDVRFEAWRFKWMNAARENSPDPGHNSPLDEKAREREHLRRCVRSSRSNLRARLNLNPRPPPLVYVDSSRRQSTGRQSTRRAALEATARIHKIYLSR
jgi:hypothetical protein